MMFEIDVIGLAELEGGKPAHRLAFEPVVNVFDEFRGYVDDRKRPSYCAVRLAYAPNPRGVTLTVADDGAGFANARDIWTLFGTTAKRSAATVSGRFNAGDKQLIALSRQASVETNHLCVTFAGGKRETHRRREPINGTIVTALMPWSKAEMAEVARQLGSVLPPPGLYYTVDGSLVAPPQARCEVHVTLPTVCLADGVLRPTTRKTNVAIYEEETPTLYELGIPVCGMKDFGFPWSLNVGQKVPVPMSRDSVTAAYAFRLIGSVIEQASMDGHRLLTEDQQGAAFVRAALDWVREPEALREVSANLYGDEAVRQSSDPIANAQAAASGSTIVSGQWFTSDTRRRMADAKILPTSKDVFGGSETSRDNRDKNTCPRCGGTGVIGL